MTPIERICAKQEARDEAAFDLASPAIEAFRQARGLVRVAVGKLGDFEGSDGVLFHTLQNLLGRIEEQAEGMLTCFSTGCGAASETIARTVVETSVNFIHITNGDRGKRIILYFRRYLKEHKDNLDHWRTFVKREYSSEEAERIVSMINDRCKGLDSLGSFTEDLAIFCQCPDESASSEWPDKIWGRFKETGHTESYWTIYHRLCASTHGSAEDTIRWLVGLYHRFDSGNHEFLVKMSAETVNFSAMMLRFAVRYYIEACFRMCVIYDQFDQGRKLQTLWNDLAVSISEMADAAGVPKQK